jgi:hypothetical protein
VALEKNREDKWELSRERERERGVTQDKEGEEYPTYNIKEEDYLHWSPLA